MTIPANVSPRVAELLKRTKAPRGRLIFALDATASREAMWDQAARLQGEMFAEAAKVGGLDVQLVYYLGFNEVRKSPWLADAHELLNRMGTIRCEAGVTKIARVLRHIRSENEREKVNAAIFVGDACEEAPSDLYDAAANLGVPLFVFQEGNNEAIYLTPKGECASGLVKVEHVFRELARLTGGAYGRFDAGAAKQLGELLRAVAAFAVGGLLALANQQGDGARKLLGQMK